MIVNITVGKPKLGKRRTVYDVRMGFLLGSYRCPFFGAARKLLELGFPESATLVMWHEGSTTWAMRGPLGKAAKLTVLENEKAGPVLRAYSTPGVVPEGTPGEPRLCHR